MAKHYLYVGLFSSLVLAVFSAGVSNAQVIRVSRVQVESLNEAFAIVEADEVETGEDLRDYAFGVISDDEGVEEINFTGKRVEMLHKQHGHILAFVPVTFDVRVVVHADGEVEINYPWYSVITIDNKTAVETELKIAIDTVRSEATVGFVKAEGKPLEPKFSARESAEIVSAIHSVLWTKLGTNRGLN